MDEYIENLYRQFLSSIGEEYDEKKVSFYLPLFQSWCLSNKKISLEYVEFLKYLGLDMDEIGLREVDKGIVDSIMNDPNKVISPYINGLTLNVRDNRLVIESPRIISSAIDVETVITENPYSKASIRRVISAHECCRDIYLGVYGSIVDRDRMRKMEILRDISDSYSDLEIEFETHNDNYFCVVRSRRKVKIKTKTMTR